ncbi:SusC/RagA family TonB-linked outer membrane protein [Pinibacter soli]|uniref:TonB-dependent receptor n=1 Tax=Pinibacter soli TaxID=3044211 RepID=A0ABT6REX7_9BACT|nr:TonB-dependent receptor [Pinibacter soli]MDI3321125.1 TonB-dependent receptor [Pinibacter soli]
MKRSLLSLFVSLLITIVATAQTTQIKGKVVDGDGAPVRGASVVIDKSNKGVSTTDDGSFSIPVKDASQVVNLTITSKGFKTIRTAAKPGVIASITMEKEISNMDEVVVVGYQTMKRRDLTSSVSSVTSKDLRDVPVSTAAEAVTGRLAGVQVTTTEGQPGATILIRVRGGGSLTQDNSPLYIVDGIQVENALSLLAPSEIASVDVLKDASATAIYGARGANGVVLITTKSGKVGKAKVIYDGTFGVRNIANTLDVMNPYDFVNYQSELYKTMYNGTSDSTKFATKYGQFADMDLYHQMPMVNWQDQVFGRNAMAQNNTINVTGGVKGTTYSLTLNNNREDAIMLGSGFKRNMASFRLDNALSDKIKMGFNIRYSSQQVDGGGTSNTGSQGNNKLRNIVKYQPYQSETTFDPDVVLDPTTYNSSAIVNPIVFVNDDVRHQKQNTIVVDGYASWQIVKNLTFKTTIGATRADSATNLYSGVSTYIARQYGNMPAATMGTSYSTSLNNSNTLAYTNTFKNKHSLNVLLGEETYQVKYNSFSATNYWYPAEMKADQVFAQFQSSQPPTAASVQPTPTSFQTQAQLLSFFGRANYSYDGKYIATVSMRADGSSKFADGHRWGYFPSASVAWRLSQEKFMQGVIGGGNVVSDIKVRASYGTAGNNRISDNWWRQTFGNSLTEGYGYSVGATSPGLTSGSLANSNLKWETTVSRNLGLDFAFMHNRLTASIDGYTNQTNDLLLLADVPPTSGYTKQLQNAGKIQNKGIELQLSGQIINKRDFTWTANFNIARNWNKVIDLGIDPTGHPRQSYQVQSGWVNQMYDFYVQLGKPVGQFYGYVTDGYYTTNDFSGYDAAKKTFILKQGVADDKEVALGGKNIEPGMLKLKNLGGDSVVRRDEDEQVLGNAQPIFTGGFNNQFTYKGFDLSIFMNFVYGNKEYNANKLEFTTTYQYTDNNLLNVVKDRYRIYDEAGNKVTDFKQLDAMNQNAKIWTPSRGNYFLHSYGIEDGSFLRINNVTLGYTLPANLLAKTKFISKVRIYATVNNLYTFTNYSGFDPEASTRRATPETPGVDYATYPRSRFYLGGLSVTF